MSENTQPNLPDFPQPNMPQPLPHDELYQYFSYAHLPPHLQEASKPFHDMATWMLRSLPYNTMRTMALAKLIEAKDCAVRAKLHKST